MTIYNELPTAFPWYDKKEKQQRFRENAQKLCDYRLISPRTGLLPFEIRFNQNVTQPLNWELYDLNDNMVLSLAFNIPALKGIQMEEGFYCYYKGEPLIFHTGVRPDMPLKLPIGAYYSVLTFEDDVKYYSEVFTVVEDLTKYIKIEFWNEGDISPLMYKASGWKQVVYIDSFVHVMEPEIEEDGERDGTDQLIPTFQRMTVKYRFSVMVPDYMKVALTSLQMHDNVYLTTDNGNRSGKIERMTTTATVENSGAYSTVDVILEQLLLLKQSCSDEMVVVVQNPWG